MTCITRSAGIALLLGIILPSVCGCRPSVGATAVGTITIDGQPAPAGIRVDFEPQVKGASSSTGYTDATGRYELKFNVSTVGVMPGESLVRLSIQPTFTGDGKPLMAEELRAIRLPDSVSRNSTLRRTVKSGANQIDIAVATDSKGGAAR